MAKFGTHLASIIFGFKNFVNQYGTDSINYTIFAL